jgi:hypothetical protein
MTTKTTRAITTREAVKLLAKRGALTGLTGVKATLGVTSYADECDVRAGIIYTTPQALKNAALSQSATVIDTAVSVDDHGISDWLDATESGAKKSWCTVGAYYVNTTIGDTPIVYRVAIKYDRRIFRAIR